ncbi:60S ribosomal L7A [Tubulinosema ratisbonensis]|uniref:60S ribosomal protein L8 n=1 Tax=Tubulinosema ratisbonensis TaxID=291195 RepID=A0A437ANG9_9MICR|nr:60S ribosomal L7A [Tubulinosema ratisbonensis]
MKKHSKKSEVHPKHLTQPHQQDERNKLIKERVYLYKNALRIPPALNQFNEPLDEKDEKEFLDFFTKYIPETRSEKKKRLKSEDPKSGPKPVLNKFGLRHVVSLIENKKAKLVLIAADVCPIEAVVFLPTLCMKMGVSYAIVKSKACLGKLVNLKETTCVALCESSVKDSAEFKKLINKANGIFADNYEITMKKWGGGVLLREKEEK